MPDWRKAEDYAYTEGLTLHEWAWEFLRRNPEYRADWASLQDKIASGELIRDMNATTEANAHYASMNLAGKWDLYTMDDPYKAAIERHFRPHFRYTTDVSILQGDTGQGAYRDGVLWVHWPLNPALRFNLLVPIEPQLEVARQILTRLRNQLKVADKVRVRTGKPQPDKFPLYVRVLDAYLDGAKDNEVGRALFADAYDPRLKAREVNEAARKLTNSGYRDLLLTPSTWNRLRDSKPRQ